MTRMLEWFDTTDVQQIDSNTPLEKCLRRVARQPDVGRPLAHPEQIGMTDIIARTIGKDDPKRLEGLLAKAVANLLRRHGKIPGVGSHPPRLYTRGATTASTRCLA